MKICLKGRVQEEFTEEFTTKDTKGGHKGHKGRR
jgi:hypothetical protein